MAATLLLLLLCALFLSARQQLEPTTRHAHGRQLQLREVDKEGLPHAPSTVLCSPKAMGSQIGCFDARVKALGNDDLPWGHEEISYPTDGTPWGIHLTGPYPDGLSYLVSWFSGHPLVGPASSLPKHDTTSILAVVHLSKKPGLVAAMQHSNEIGRNVHRHKGSVITYTRVYTEPAFANFSYLSPFISHAVLRRLSPSTLYYYSVGKGKKWSEERSFRTLPGPSSAKRYPLRLGLVGDVGQSTNSSTTRDRMLLSRPQVILMVGDNSYADNYDASSPDFYDGDGSNQNRWDSYAVMWQSLAASVPMLNCAGNHEIEKVGISAKLTPVTTHFSYPTNYPFQAYAARYPAPGVVSRFGAIDSNLYYSTVIAGRIKLITLNSYVPFHLGSPQHKWGLRELQGLRRSETPWLVVQLHAAPYHTYWAHYKELECFMSVWEELFFMHGVDLVLSGHVHAYERTHPVFNYEQDSCAPVYLTLGDGGNVEGPARYFVDQVDPLTNTTYCKQLVSEGGMSPREVHASRPNMWGPAAQRAVQPSGCPTTSWQPAQGVDGGPPLLLLDPRDNEQGAGRRKGEEGELLQQAQGPLGFCQSSQPVWSAHRDPSFGHGLLEVTSDRKATFTWYRNADPPGQHADRVVLERDAGCAAMTSSGRRRRMERLRARTRRK